MTRVWEEEKRYRIRSDVKRKYIELKSRRGKIEEEVKNTGNK